ncbi:MAG: cadmium-translocating P-type ATPase [Clostridia bacterium]|nr:cadmium-translocating P-type ATPase [Clostridia bacterium]
MRKFDITGMSCAACSARVQKAVSGVAGVDECSVNLLTNIMAVSGTASDEEIVAAVKRAGYGAAPADEERVAAARGNGAHKPLLKRFLWSLLFLALIMYMTMGHVMLGLPLPGFLENDRAVSGAVQMILTSAVMVINGRFFISGAKGAFKLAPNMDTLVSLGSFASFAYSVAVLIKTMRDPGFSGDYYFESAAMILTLITLGKMLEARAKGKTTNAINALARLVPDTAAVIRNGVEEKVAISDIKAGDIVAVRPGESIAADGVVIKGYSAVDESALTGESIPVDKTEGSGVFSGTVNISGYMEIRATAVGGDTMLRGIIKTVADAAAGKAPIAKAADKAAGVFVPAVLLIAAITAAVWLALSYPFSVALTRAVSLLVISCPCALGLATPVAIMAASGVGAKHGVLFKNAAAVEEAGKAKIAALDKTGTVTEGKPVVTDIYCAHGVNRAELLALAYALEEKSEHPLSYAVTEYSKEYKTGGEAEDFTAVPGGGVTATVGGKKAFGGNIEYIRRCARIPDDVAEKTEELSREGKTPLVFALEDKVLGVIFVADSLKPDAEEGVAELKRMGLRVVMLTGDNPATASVVARAAGADEVFAGLLPGDKANRIRELKNEGKVLMAGDGINDAPALTVADTGVAIGAGADIAAQSADIVLVKSNVSDIVTAIKLSRAAYRNIKQNLFWAFFYNAACIPLAAGVFAGLGVTLDPMICAAAMSLSSVFVVSNSLRLNLFKPFIASGRVCAEEAKEGKMMITMKIEGVMCAHCEARIKAALEAVDGVACARVSHETGTALIELSGAADNAALTVAVENAGYKVLGIE